MPIASIQIWDPLPLHKKNYVLSNMTFIIA